MTPLASGLILMMALTASREAPAEAAQADPFATNACVQCHRDLPGRSSHIVEVEWKQSVHYANKVGCEGCHGGDATVRREQFESLAAFKRASHLERNPEFLLLHREGQEFVSAARGRSVSYFCGRCHADIKEKHLGSPHGDFGDPTCLYCHGQGTHLIAHPTPQIIDTRSRSEGGRCSPCHRAATMEAVGRIKKILADTQTQIESSGKLYKQLEAWGYHNLELERLHHHADQVSSHLRQIFHSFNMREINNYTAEIQLAIDRTEATYELVNQLRKAQRQQTLVGAAAVVLLLSFSGLLVYYKNKFLEHDHAPSLNHSPGAALDDFSKEALSQPREKPPREASKL